MAKTENLRNICLMGHGGDGKTSLAESMLFLTGGTDRLGKVPDGNTISDFDPEEIKRQISISATPLPVEYGDYKLNILDTPGYFDFVGETIECLRVAEAGLVTVSSKGGVEVGTEKAVRLLTDRKLPRFFYVSKIDEENADYVKTFNSLRETFGISVCPVVMPAKEGGKVVGVVDIVRKKAFKIDGKKTVEMPVPSEMADTLEELYGILAENVAETSEELMEKFFGGEEFSTDELVAAIRAGVRTLSIAPVFCGSALSGIGTETLLSGLCDYAPSPLEGIPERSGDAELKADPNGPAAAIVFKTLSDQYGKFSFFKVVSGKVTSDLTLHNARTDGSEKFGHIYIMKGKKNTEVKEIVLGDIGTVSKLTETKTGDTLTAVGSNISLAGIEFPPPSYSMAIAPKQKGGEEKIASGLTRLAEEDPTFSFGQNTETRQMIISGMGDIHIDVLMSKLRSKFGTDTELHDPRVAYREKIKKKVKVEGKHKKQSGGHGQFGHVWIEFEPADESEALVFEEKIFGGSVPKNFHPAVEKGLRDCIQHGVLAGYPVVGLKATLVDGSYHDVDSSEMAFKLAASLAYKAGLAQANPVLMEPIGKLNVTIPDSYMGDIIGDLNKRRGRVLGMAPNENGEQIVEAEVPMAEMASYAIDLRSMTQGRGSFTLDFERYEEAPMNIQQKVVEETKALRESEE
ncbi:elongation factor G [Oscillospiraceae bacterium OttesenSCG-928-G22]|nr:elongation factor G [Oscillospiraceae bacterium OttesenSCG-928-G22]